MRNSHQYFQCFDLSSQLGDNQLQIISKPSWQNFKVFFFLEDEPVEIDFASETDLAVVLANHLFGKLATSSSYTIDKTCHAKRKGNRCFCNDEKCVLKGVYGDTSIGTNTWLFEYTLSG